MAGNNDTADNLSPVTTKFNAGVVIKQLQRHPLVHHLVNDTGDQPLLSNISDFL
jgi:hypothetical protein